jgi:flagellin-like protein
MGGVEALRLLKSRRAISPLIATVLLLGLTIVTGVLVIGMTTDWFRGASNIEAVDTSKTMAYMDQSTGKGKLIIVLKNTGTSPLRLYRIAISCKIDPATITFDGIGNVPQVSNSTVVATGSLYGSSTSVAIITSGSTKILIIPSGQTATIEFSFTGGTNSKMTDLFNVGGSYRAMIYSASGAGGVHSFTFDVGFG